ncbi:Protein of unknown function [Cohaesibacter sp. ES.047]|uniref:DUF1176 domain-containing protein n=1 Tax=Cohaesibacter sp. ES.047 TaxID=1798205 RepID=UPI000BC06BF9|nr:DUF1176 domain-containing protein [Cohaesibacter sp. ES.047]SNY91886.1 Protein of unknown function [Cohaesibacter sp. ES.047]
MITRTLFAVLAAASILFTSQPSLARSYKEIRDITVWCDTAMNCTLSLVPETYQGVTSLSVYRANRLGNALSVRMASQVPITPGTRFLITIDGTDTLTLIATNKGIREDGAAYHESNPDVVAWLVKAMKSGSVATVKIDNGTQAMTSRFSLSGSVAGMIYMDEYQDLLNTSYALQVKGDQPPNPRIPIVALHGQSQIPRQIWQTWFAPEDALCHFYGSTAVLESGVGFRLTLHNADLYGLPCGMGGAYNQPYAFFTVPLDESRAITRTPFYMDGNESSNANEADAWNISFSGKDFMLKGLFKGRGLGDCGSQSVWQLHEEGKRVFFEAVEFREKGECDGVYAGGPDNWPVTWPD